MKLNIILALSTTKLLALTAFLFIACATVSYAAGSAGLINTLNTQPGGVANIGTDATSPFNHTPQTPTYTTEYHLVKPDDIPQCNGSTCTATQYATNYASCPNGGFINGPVTSNSYTSNTNYYTYNCVILTYPWYFTSTSAQYAIFVKEAAGLTAWTNPNGSIPEWITTVLADATMPAPQTVFITNNCLHVSQWAYNSSGTKTGTNAQEAYPFSTSTTKISFGSSSQSSSTTTASSNNCNTAISVPMTVSAGNTVTIKRSFSGSNAGMFNGTNFSSNSSPYSNQFTPLFNGNSYSYTAFYTQPQCTGTYTVQAGDVGNNVYLECCTIIKAFPGNATSVVVNTSSQGSSYTAIAPCS